MGFATNIHIIANVHVEQICLHTKIETVWSFEFITMKMTKEEEIENISERNVPFPSNAALQNVIVSKVHAENEDSITDPKTKTCVTEGHD